jgi:hypothetical protein
MPAQLINIKHQKNLHFTLLAFCSVSFLTLLYFSEKSVDSSREIYDALAFIVSGSWTVLLFILALLTDEDKVLDKIGKGYRTALSSKLFIVCSNLILFAIIIPLTYELAAYRQVEIHFDYSDAVIVEVISPFSKKIGEVKLSKPIKVRLKTGTVELYYYDVADRENQTFPGSEILNVKPFWVSMPEVHLNAI